MAKTDKIAGRGSGRSGLPRLIVIAAAGLAFVWLGGFLDFVANLPRDDAGSDAGADADAIVVLTGGSARLDKGVDLLLAGKAGALLVTGVDPATTAEALQARSQAAPEKFDCCISLGHMARDTTGNAKETAAWIADAGHDSLILVTASYHMPRSLLLFRQTMPGIDVIPHPVFSGNVKVENWWRHPGTTRLLASEFSKYLFSLVRVRLINSPGSGGPGA
jgi:uncharacterized SAM-binding protein YcdF (DUF218 family)